MEKTEALYTNMTYINHINMSITVKNLTFSYDEKCLVENLNFDISNGSIGLIKGESGSGKSTLLNVIAGLKKASIDLDRKTLANIAVNDKEAFSKIAEEAKSQLAA